MIIRIIIKHVSSVWLVFWTDVFLHHGGELSAWCGHRLVGRQVVGEPPVAQGEGGAPGAVALHAEERLEPQRVVELHLKNMGRREGEKKPLKQEGGRGVLVVSPFFGDPTKSAKPKHGVGPSLNATPPSRGLSYETGTPKSGAAKNWGVFVFCFCFAGSMGRE